IDLNSSDLHSFLFRYRKARFHDYSEPHVNLYFLFHYQILYIYIYVCVCNSWFLILLNGFPPPPAFKFVKFVVHKRR
ncbi:MAG: hypothetical protein J8272_00340, partial ['Prunus persica' phytoplasma PP2]|nr:hypothetical protein ['Prunus persica' phytoplasma PP2]